MMVAISITIKKTLVVPLHPHESFTHNHARTSSIFWQHLSPLTCLSTSIHLSVNLHALYRILFGDCSGLGRVRRYDSQQNAHAGQDLLHQHESEVSILTYPKRCRSAYAQRVPYGCEYGGYFTIHVGKIRQERFSSFFSACC